MEDIETVAMTNTTLLPILAFNDVYRVTQKYTAPAGHGTRNADTESGTTPPKEQKITVAQFGRTLLEVREKWNTLERIDEKTGEKKEDKEGLVLFAGDGES